MTLSIDQAVADPLSADFDPDNLEQYAAQAQASDLVTPPEALGEYEAEQTVEASEPVVAAEPEPEAKVETPEPAAEPAGVLTKDGKHVIPFEVLERERAARRQLEEQVARLAKGQPQAPVQQGESTPERQALEQMHARLQQLEAERNAMVERQVQEAIDANPKLAYVQSLPDQAAYNTLVEIDALLRAKPEYAAVPMSQRFAKAVAMFEAAEGPINLPGAVAKPAQDEAAAKAATEIVAKAERAAAAPRTLSDIPGTAVPPREGPLAKFKDATDTQILDTFMNLDDPKEIDRALARLL